MKTKKLSWGKTSEVQKSDFHSFKRSCAKTTHSSTLWLHGHFICGFFLNFFGSISIFKFFIEWTLLLNQLSSEALQNKFDFLVNDQASQQTHSLGSDNCLILFYIFYNNLQMKILPSPEFAKVWEHKTDEGLGSLETRPNFIKINSVSTTDIAFIMSTLHTVVYLIECFWPITFFVVRLMYKKRHQSNTNPSPKYE